MKLKFTYLGGMVILFWAHGALAGPYDPVQQDSLDQQQFIKTFKEVWL